MSDAELASYAEIRRTWTRRQRWKNDALYLAVATLFQLLPLVPRRRLARAGEALGALALRLFPRARRTAEANVEQVFPDLAPAARDALVRRSYARLGGWFGEALATASGRPSAVLPFAAGGADIVRQARSEGRGIVLVSAHLGPWEQVASSLVAHGVPLVTLTRGAYDPRLDFVYRRLRGHAGVRGIERSGPGSTARIVRTLRGGGVLGAPMDLSTRARSIDATLLGRRALTAVGPARLALAANAVVLVVTAGPDVRGSGLALHVSRLDDVSPDAPGRTSRRHRHADAAALTQRLNDALGDRIRSFPEGWVWMHERFAERSRPRERGVFDGGHPSENGATLDVRRPPRRSWLSRPPSL